jgi:hypothetical protein
MDQIASKATFRPSTANACFKSRQGRIEERLFNEASELTEKKKALLESMEREAKKKMRQKLSDSSKIHFKSKISKEIELVFNQVVSEKNRPNINYKQFGHALKKFCLFKTSDSKRTTEREVRIHEKLWKTLDPNDKGEANFESFKQILLLILDPSAIAGVNNYEFLSKELYEEIQYLRLNRLSYLKGDVVNDKFTSKISSLERNESKIAKEPRYELLLRRQEEIDKRKEREKQERLEKEMKECTFKPKLGKNLVDRRKKTDNVSHFEYLYKQKDAEKKFSSIVDLRTSLEKELENCTFQPDRIHTKKFDKFLDIKRKLEDSITDHNYSNEYTEKSVVNSIISKESHLTPKGYQVYVQRLRKANEQEKFDYHKSLREGLKVDNSKTPTITVFKPFHFQLKDLKKKKLILIMDVNIGAGSSGRINIQEGDDPEILARNFSRAYKLDSTLTKRLAELIRENIEKNINNQELTRHGSNHELKLDDNSKFLSNASMDTIDRKLLKRSYEKRSKDREMETTNVSETGIEEKLLTKENINNDLLSMNTGSTIAIQTISSEAQTLLNYGDSSTMMSRRRNVLDNLKQLKHFTEHVDIY